MKKKILLALLLVFIGIQFFRSDRNAGEVYGPNDMAHALDVPADIKLILERACNDCHSNNTLYPWYTNIQPVGWWMAKHVKDGKRNINFSEYNTYKIRRKLHKLDEIIEQINEDEMPPGYYTLMHGNAKLSGQDKTRLIEWCRIAHAAIDTVTK